MEEDPSVGFRAKKSLMDVFYEEGYDHTMHPLRNDFVFSIAIHIMNGFKSNDQWPKPMPARMFTTTDCDILHKIDGDRYTFFLDKESHPGQYTVNSVRGCRYLQSV